MDRPIIFSAPMVCALLDGRKTQTRRLATSPLRRCERGDRLYVRESFALVGGCDPGYPITRADYPECVPAYFENVPATAGEIRWTPSIHMPRWASRLTLIVESVRIEPLQAIGDEDAIAEGVVDTGRRDGAPYPHCIVPGVPEVTMEHDPVSVYAGLWEHLHGEGSWTANPNVLVLTFRVVRGNIDRLSA